MRIWRIAAGAVAVLALGVAAARAQPLTVGDTVGFIPLPFLAAPNTAFLQSRTFSGAAGTPAAGRAGYMYRISLTQASGSGGCLGGLVLNFGPALKLPYAPNQLADVFVITSGGIGSIGLKSAERFGEVIEFDLAKPLCLEGAPNLANTTFFFGLAADTPSRATSAQIFSSGNPPSIAWTRACRAIEVA